MLAEELLRLKGVLRDGEMLFCYGGSVTDHVLTGLGEALRQELEHAEVERKRARNVFAVFVELAQNVLRYSDEVDIRGGGELRRGYLSVGLGAEGIWVACANRIDPAGVPRLGERLKKIHGLDGSALKALYKETLKGEVPEGSKGAGVGFIDIARKSSGGFDFDFVDDGGGRTYFCMRAVL